MVDKEVFTTGGRFVSLITALKLCVLVVALLLSFAFLGVSGVAFENFVANGVLTVVCVAAACWAAMFVPRLFMRTYEALRAFSDAWWTSLRRNL